jgi:fumarylacetoacetase
MSALDATHDPQRQSWVATANGHPDFPIQNLPFCIFTPKAGGPPRGGVAIGNSILDVAAALAEGLLDGAARPAAEAAAGPVLNDLFAFEPSARQALRARLGDLLDAAGPERTTLEGLAGRLLHAAADCTLHLPARIGDYTDFYVGIHHATNVGRVFRPDNPLLPNYKHVPIGYHGRASSVAPSGTPVRRPNGQRKPATEDAPSFGPSRNLDYELELGIWIGAGNALGDPIRIAEAGGHVAGFCLLNDWSARDIQGWEYQPLGPFLSKSFGTSVSPFVVTSEALAPFRMAQLPRAAEDPVPLPYLLDATDQRQGALDITLEVLISTPGLRQQGLPPQRLALSSTRHMYWTVAQMVAHHTSNGCNLNPGDLLGSGTLSGPDAESCGSLLEASRAGKEPVKLASGEERRFLEDGDEVIFRARAERDGFVSIGFGECRGRVVPAA